MPTINTDRLCAYRERTFRLPPWPRVTSPEEALAFVNERGFVFFWPIKKIVLPSLWTAVAGDRPVGDSHDDPGHITWGWKDEALGKRIWYYAKVLRRKSPLIALDLAPYFYALSANYGSPEEDHIQAYEEGRLPYAGKQVYEAILREGALNTLDLRRAARLTSRANETEFQRALEHLQADFKIMPVGIAHAGGWRYSFIFDITAHHLPDLPARARWIDQDQAREKLAETYFLSVGAARLGDTSRLLGWSNEVTRSVLLRLVGRGFLGDGLQIDEQPGEFWALMELIE